MAEKYTTHNVFLKSADLNVLVLEFPSSDVNDKLSLLASERGLIYKTLYEDFLIGTCMSSSGPFFYHIRKRPELLIKFHEIRTEVLSSIYKHSPGFKPENIVINQNNVLKTKDSIRKGEKVRPLTDNDLWDQDPPLSNFGPAVITSAPNKDEGINPFAEEGEDELPDLNDLDPFGQENDGMGMVPYDLIGHQWIRMGLLLTVRKFEESDDNLIRLIGPVPFKTKEGYHLLIVERCVEDYADIFQILEQMGHTSKTSPPELMEELYNIALLYNPSLKLENIDLKQIRSSYKETQKPEINNKKTLSAGAETKKAASAQKKKFADIPKEKLRELSAEMRKKIIGQDAAIDNLVDAIQRAAVGLKREHEPVGVFLFTGITGTGKSETAKALAECLEAHLVRLDCQEYQQPHEVAKLAGSPNGYVGYEDGGHLTKEVAKYPFSVVLLDEVEKAHSAFHERVLHIIDDGILTDNKGNKVPFKDTIIIMTSNIGVKEVDNISRSVGFGGASKITDESAGKARGDALKKKFKPEFLNRVDEIINFRRLDKENYLGILAILLNEVSEQIKKAQEISLNFNDEANDFLLSKGIDPKYGARPLRRAVKKYLNTPLAKALLSEEIKNKSRVNVSLNETKDCLLFKTAKKVKKVEA